jgi:hypothetical protein
VSSRWFWLIAAASANFSACRRPAFAPSTSGASCAPKPSTLGEFKACIDERVAEHAGTWHAEANDAVDAERDVRFFRLSAQVL